MSLLWLDRAVGDDGRVDDVDVADGGRLGDAGLFVLLQQERVDVGVDLGEAHQAGLGAFGLGKLAQPGFVLGDLLLDRGLLLDQVEPGGFEGGLDLVLQLVDLPLDRLDLGVPLGVLGHQGPSLHLQLGQLGGHRADQRVVLEGGRRVDPPPATGLLHRIQGELDLVALQGDRGALLLDLGEFPDQFLGFGVQLDHAAGRFVRLQVLLGPVQLFPGSLELVLDEFDGVAGLFGPEGEGLFQVRLHQGVDHGAGQDRVGVVVGDLDDVGLLADLAGLDRSPQTFDGSVEVMLPQPEAVALLPLDLVEQQGQVLGPDPLPDSPLHRDAAVGVLYDESGDSHRDAAVGVRHAGSVRSGQFDRVVRLLMGRREFGDPES